MPVTRSNKGAPSAAEKSAEESSEGATESTAATGTEVTASSNATRTETTTGTATTGTATTAATAKTTTSSSRRTEQKGEKAGQIKENRTGEGSNMTLVPLGPPRAPSIRSTRSRKRELDAKEDLARLELEQAKAAALFARARLERLQLDEGMSSDEEREPEDRANQVQEWVETTVREEIIVNPNSKYEHREKSATRKSDMAVFATEIVKALNSRQQPPKYIHELPYFDGNTSEWIAFKTVFEDTAAMFNDVQNIARMRKAVRGVARDAIKSLLYSDCSPAEVLDALQRRFGRPESLVLCELEKIKTLVKPNDGARELCIFASQVNNSVAAIKGLSRPQYLHSPEIVKIIVDKLPSVLKYRWYDYAAEMDCSLPELVNISVFLNKEADKCGAFATPENLEKPKRFEPKRFVNKQATHTARENYSDKKFTDKKFTDKKFMNSDNRVKCPHCEEEHHLSDCRKFLSISVQERWDIVKSLRLCFKCLRDKHRKDACRRNGCGICKRWHHRLLHVDLQQTPPDQQQEVNNTEVTTNLVNVIRTDKAYLKMLPVELYGPKGSVIVLALLDEGSTISLLDSNVAKVIGAEGPKHPFSLQTVGGKKIVNANSQRLNIKIKGAHHMKTASLNGVRTIDNMNLTSQRLQEIDVCKFPHLKDIAQQVCYSEQSPKLLIGQDNWELIVTRSLKRGRRGQPVASMTLLGWVLHGCNTRQVNFVDQCMHLNQDYEDLEQLMKDHFSIESLGIAPKRPSTDADNKAVQILEKTSRRLPSGRFEVGLLWKNKEEKIPDSLNMAEKRLCILERKFEKNPHLKEEYTAQIENLLKMGYAEEVPIQGSGNIRSKNIPIQGVEIIQGGENNRRKWYLPHFSVVHPQKKKLRVVFDAAAKSGGKSLNDRLLAGPDLLQSLFGVLLRFREGTVALAADIKEMFLQIRILPEDRDCLRFLWKKQGEKGYKKYRMTSVIFGATSSPCTAIFIKNKNAEAMQEQYPEAAKAIIRNHYMDDYLQSFRNEEDARNIAKQVDTVHKQACFELRGWASNKLSALTTVMPEDTKEIIEVSILNKEEKTLGMKWITNTDVFGFNANLRNTPDSVLKGSSAPTKRQVTSAVMSTFDPMGLIAPVLIQGKKLLQDIWRSGIGWDEEIGTVEQETWRRYLTSLDIIPSLHIPRCIAPHDTKGELHVFCDASETAYGAAAYWRTNDSEENTHVTLVAGKARVAPTKPLSIPRLELQAALLAARLANSIGQELDLKAERTVYWSDSTTVLAWIKTDPRSFKTFVAHRLAEIEETTKPKQWRWVPTAMNPADDATRKVPSGFESTHRWFVGPAFLYLPEEDWPKPRNQKPEKTGEEKEAVVATVIITENSHVTPDPVRKSSWNRLLRATARVLQFIELCRPSEKVNAARKKKESDDPSWKKTKGKAPRVVLKKNVKRTEEITCLPLEAHLLERAEKLLIKRCQQESFPEEYKKLSKNEEVPRNSRLRKLDVVMEDELIRLRGRINAAKGVSRQYKRPAVVESRHHIGKLIIAHYHERYNHGNHLTVMNEIRQKYSMLSLRTTLRHISSNCQWCRVYRAKPQNMPPGDLPIERLRHGAPPFQCTAVDYFGPMTVTIGRRHEKRWGALFTCLTVRAVHIELVPSLSTDSMILALRRFAARRGMPKTIFSDNGTNFVGADRELREAAEALKASDIAAAAEHLGVSWKFIPPGAPNMGGAWERLVRSIKTALQATLHERHPREEVLHTLLLEAEHIVNSRPLTDAGISEEESLTPNHFLIGRSSGTTSIGIFADRDLVGPNTWKTAQKLADYFWSKWVREYLPTLLPRRIDEKASLRDLRVGDVVVIGDHTLPRCSWPRGTIQRVYPGPDGHVRVADVATSGGVMRRPSSRIVMVVPRRSPQAEDGAAHKGENVGDRQCT